MEPMRWPPAPGLAAGQLLPATPGPGDSKAPSM